MAAASNAGADAHADDVRLASFRSARRAFSEAVSARSGASFVEEFAALAAETKPGALVPMRRELSVLNRYDDVLPIAKSHVQLAPWGARESPGLYINANHVDFGREDRYILTQGPLAATVSHFWQMVWQHSVHLVVMLGECEEAGVEKVCPYWPQSPGESMICEGTTLSVTLEEDRLHRSELWSQRTFSLRTVAGLGSSTATDESRHVVQMQMHGWIDHGTPRESDLAIFLALVDSQKRSLDRASSASRAAEVPPPPTVVHCSAGVGRSGVFVGLRVLMRRTEGYLAGALKVEPARLFDVVAVIKRMRTSRVRCVQTPAQFEFMHRFLLYVSEKYMGFDFSTF